MFSESRCSINFWMLLKMRRPSLIVLRIKAKLLSVRIISNAFLATSDPACPIAIPTSACLRDGGSFILSPVSREAITTTKGVDHAYFSLRCAAGDDLRKGWQRIHLFIWKLIKLTHCHDHGRQASSRARPSSKTVPSSSITASLYYRGSLFPQLEILVWFLMSTYNCLDGNYS